MVSGILTVLMWLWTDQRIGLCKDTFSIVAPNVSVYDQSTSSCTTHLCICDDEAILSCQLLSIQVSQPIGWWPSGGVALVQNSLTYQPASLNSATYYAEALNVADGCPSLRTSIPFTVHPLAILQDVADPVLCAPGTINMDALVPGVLNGVSGTGSWFNLATNQPVSGTIQPASGDSWYYVFTSNPGMCVSTDTMCCSQSASGDGCLWIIVMNTWPFLFFESNASL